GFRREPDSARTTGPSSSSREFVGSLRRSASPGRIQPHSDRRRISSLQAEDRSQGGLEMKASRKNVLVGVLTVVLAGTAFPSRSAVKKGAEGSWAKLAHLAPDFTGTMMLLTDGSVMVQGYDPGDNWMRLAADGTGSFVNGTWSNLASMSIPRLYF